MTTILFVCSANRFRSVIAAECLQVLANADPIANSWTISSAGTWAQEGLPPIPQALKIAESHGLNISHVRSKEINGALIKAATLVIMMTESQREALSLEFPQWKSKLFLLSEVFEGQTYDIHDPAERLEETTEEIGEEICRLITSGFSRIRGVVRKIEMTQTNNQ